MFAPLRISFVLLLICGGVYPVLVTLVRGAIFPYQANGSIIIGSDGQPVGFELIAQAFDKNDYLHPRPSVAGADGYDATSSGGSNLGPTNQKLIDRVSGDASALQAQNPSLQTLPADLLTTSGSGLDSDVLDAVPTSLQPKVKAALHTSMNAENREAAELAIDQFEATYGAKYSKAVDKILKDREVLLTHFDFPAEHWVHLRTTNAIESTFATVRLRTNKTKGSGSRTAGLAMGLQALDGSPGPLAIRQCTPPGRARSRWGDLRGWPSHRARGPAIRRVITTGRSTTIHNISLCPPSSGCCRRRSTDATSG